MGSLVAELAEKLSSATNNLDFDEQTMFLNTSADTVGIGTNNPASKLDVRGTVQVGVNDTGHDVNFYGAAAGARMYWAQGNNRLELHGPSADAAGSSGALLFATLQTAIEDGDIIGRMDFEAPAVTAAGDSRMIGASIWAEADATFTNSVNSTELVFATGASEVAAEKVRIASDG
jgi:hypothetical protein